MRNLKFRYWDGTKMVYNVVPFIEAVSGLVLHDSRIWMEFTGVTDETGTPIYEGDIIVRNFGFGGNGVPYPVTWDEYSDGEYTAKVQCWMAHYPISDSGSDHVGLSKNTLKVIGNIYENPRSY